MDADTLGVEGVEPTLGLVAWAERVKSDVRSFFSLQFVLLGCGAELVG